MLVQQADWLRSPCTSTHSTSCICHLVPLSHSRNHQNQRQPMTQSQLRCRTGIIQSSILVQTPSSWFMARPPDRLCLPHEKRNYWCPIQIAQSVGDRHSVVTIGIVTYWTCETPSPAWWWWLLLLSLLEKWCSNCVWNSLVFSYLASLSGVVCVVCPFAHDEKLKNIHVDLALLIWGPALLSTHAPLSP